MLTYQKNKKKNEWLLFSWVDVNMTPKNNWINKLIFYPYMFVTSSREKLYREKKTPFKQYSGRVISVDD